MQREVLAVHPKEGRKEHVSVQKREPKDPTIGENKG